MFVVSMLARSVVPILVRTAPVGSINSQRTSPCSTSAEIFKCTMSDELSKRNRYSATFVSFVKLSSFFSSGCSSITRVRSAEVVGAGLDGISMRTSLRGFGEDAAVLETMAPRTRAQEPTNHAPRIACRTLLLSIFIGTPRMSCSFATNMPSSARRNVLIPRELPANGFPRQPYHCSPVGRAERPQPPPSHLHLGNSLKPSESPGKLIPVAATRGPLEQHRR